MKIALLDRQQSLVQWVSKATGINSFGVKVRLLGNDLHILCEGRDCPQRWQTLSDLLKALQQTDLDSLTSEEQSSVYQVFVYGRKKGEYRPEWCHRVYLNQLDKHLEQVQSTLASDPAHSQQPGGALIVSNESLARQGDPDAIARYLSENLSSLGIAVKVKTKQHHGKFDAAAPRHRLWIFCQSTYSPDALLIEEAIAQRLRHLHLVGYEDAIIVSQVRGETEPDWRLRVDLTPPDLMLKEWARWGDVQAIAKLLTAAFAELKVAVQASLKESTLHIFCTPAFDPLETASAPDQQLCLQVIIAQLEAIAPQGILAAAIYGQKTGKEKPTWVDWLSLPATEHPALATPTLDLGISGDEPAITFLLERLLNPNLDWRLKTGGIRVLLRPKANILHIMCDAPVCPTRQQVAHKVTQFIRQLKISGIIGVRVYGRRAGDKEPVWHHGIDFQQRPRLVPEPTPEFAATSEYINALISMEPQESVLRPDLTTQEIRSFVQDITKSWSTTWGNRLKNWLLETQLFTEVNDANAQNPDPQKLQSGFIWLCLGIMLTLQSDWMLGYVIAQTMANSNLKKSGSSVTLTGNQSPKPTLFPGNQQITATDNKTTFNSSGFTQLPLIKEKATATAILLAARSQMSSFNVRQLDEQLALYKQHLATHGHPPDILILGSSRALRGIDPVALTQFLARHDYGNIDIFNFGINGATSQVVDFIVSKVLDPAELPKMILWADGSRAFNDGREDITFNAIATSKGYEKALDKAKITSNESPEKSESKPLNKAEITSYQAANEWLNQVVANLSASYKNREQIKNLLQKQLTHLPFADLPQPAKSNGITNDPEEDNTHQEVDFDGFLPLSIRFNPDIYFQKHPRVPGNYDNDYKTFQLGGKQNQAFTSVIEFTTTHKIPLVFINLPLTGEYLDPTRKKYEQEFQDYMLAISAKNPNFIYRDLSLTLLSANDYFSDPSHLNRYGAYEVSQKLANDVMIPWLHK